MLSISFLTLIFDLGMYSLLCFCVSDIYLIFTTYLHFDFISGPLSAPVLTLHVDLGDLKGLPIAHGTRHPIKDIPGIHHHQDIQVKTNALLPHNIGVTGGTRGTTTMTDITMHPLTHMIPVHNVTMRPRRTSSCIVEAGLVRTGPTNNRHKILKRSLLISPIQS